MIEKVANLEGLGIASLPTFSLPPRPLKRVNKLMWMVVTCGSISLTKNGPVVVVAVVVVLVVPVVVAVGVVVVSVVPLVEGPVAVAVAVSVVLAEVVVLALPARRPPSIKWCLSVPILRSETPVPLVAFSFGACSAYK